MFQVDVLKFGYSDTQQRQIFKWKIFSNFVAFSEYPNFKILDWILYVVEKGHGCIHDQIHKIFFD